MTPVLIPCSRSAHDQNVLARRPQWDQHGCHSRESETASFEGSGSSQTILLLAEAAQSECAPSMRAVKDSLVTSSYRETSKLGEVICVYAL